MFKNIQFYQWVILLWLGLSGGIAQAATDCNVVTKIPVSECQSLLELYNSTNGANWTNNTGWNQTNTPCSWIGVTCSAGHVERLFLHERQMSGSIPNLNLPNLLYLWLYGNQLSGRIPNFTNLPNLQVLSLFSNQLSGSIPNFSNLPNLASLRLDNNQLSGSVPDFSNLPNLTYLKLSNNQLSGSIPNFNLPNLTYLDLSNNQLSGSIPNFTAFNLANLETIRFSGNCGLTVFDTAQEAILTEMDQTWKTRNPNCSTFSSYNLMLDKIGNGQIDGTGNYIAGVTVNLSAIPDSGWRFGGWSPSPCNSLFQMPANDLSCTADFVQIIGDLQFKSERCKNSPLEAFDGCYEESSFPIGSKLKITLNSKIITNRYQRFDLWVAIQLPSGDFLFMTSQPFNRFKFMDSYYKGEAFMPNIEAAERSDTIFEFDVPFNFGGKYTFYALYVALGKNPLLRGESVWLSNLAIKEINLASK